MQLLLVVAGVVGLALGQLGSGLALLALTLGNALLGVQGQGRPAAPATALRRMVAVGAQVRRDGAPRRLASEELVPGDVVLVGAGDVVPADGRLLESAALEVDESALTGEFMPVCKGVEVVDDASAPLGERTDMVYMGTSVGRGSAEFVVTATGADTEVGEVSRLLRAPSRRPLTDVGTRVLPIAGAALAVSLAFDVVWGEMFDAVLSAAVAFAVAAVPTGLPVAMAAILARGARALARSGATVKRPRAVATLGETSAIVCDRAALTLGRPTAVELTLPGSRHTISGGAIRRPAGRPEVPLEPLLLPLALASDAVVADGEPRGDPTEAALVVFAETAGLDVAATREAHPRLATLPFDADRRLRATFHRMQGDAGEVVRCFVWGAPDRLLARAATVLGDDLRPTLADEADRDAYLGEATRLAGQGLRVVATGRCDIRLEAFVPSADLLPLVDRLTLLALVGLEDPPHPEARASVAAARAAGVTVRMLTADGVAAAEATARRLGLEGTDAIAQATAAQELSVVDALRADGTVVALFGDAMRDAPALTATDVGIATGRGTEVAREAAAVLVADGSLATLASTVERGRLVAGELAGCVRFHAGVLAGLILTFVGASVLNVAGGVPFMPLQTLFVTLAIVAPLSTLGGPAAGASVRRTVALAAVYAAATLGVMALAEHQYGTATARLMGLATFALISLLEAAITRMRRCADPGAG